MSLSFPSIWVPGSSFILASCLIGKEAVSSILLDQWFLLDFLRDHAVLGTLLSFVMILLTETHRLVIKYGDDTVIYYSAGTNIGMIESMLSEDMNLIAQYFNENELIINLKKGKIEMMCRKETI